MCSCYFSCIHHNKKKTVYGFHVGASNALLVCMNDYIKGATSSICLHLLWHVILLIAIKGQNIPMCPRNNVNPCRLLPVCRMANACQAAFASLQTLRPTHHTLGQHNGLSHHRCRNQHCTSVMIVFCPLQHLCPFVPQDKGNSHMLEL